MLTILLLIINLGVTILGIYIFDYQVDNIINSPLVIILSLLVGTIVMLLTLLLYIEGLYLLVAKNQPKTSMLKHKIANQMVSIPMHLLNMRINVIGKENLPKN